MSSTSLIRRLLERSEELDLLVKVNDANGDLAKEKIGGNPRGEAIHFDALDSAARRPYLEAADIVVSMLPARFHPIIIDDCIELGKNVITPSYISPELKAMEDRINAAGILVLNEIGLDPGIDHMSAMMMVDEIKAKGGEMERFESFTGGLIAPESDNNPWNYKFTWNPRNVVLAGQGGAARFVQEGQYKYIPYNRLFTRLRPIEIEGYGEFEGYANRDSLSYKEIYKMQNVPTLYRGTLRRKGFSESWNIFVQMGMTDDAYQVDDCANLTWRTFMNSFLSYDQVIPLEEKLRMQIPMSDEVFEKLKWLGFFENENIGMKQGTPAQILQRKLEQKLSLEDGDKDMIVMWHRFNYSIDGTKHEMNASMVVIGDENGETAMSKTVGLPVAIACEQILQGGITKKGLCIPVEADIYGPVMRELKKCGIEFKEKLLF
jgi:saccharopine dehydrogenase-like NADP-dependent oxidoreductase